MNLLLLLCNSCKKEESQVNLPIVTNEGITYRDGRLIFKDQSTFNEHQRWLFENQGNRQLIVDKNKSFGFKSMTEYYFEGMNLEETDPLFLSYVDDYPNIFNKVNYDNSILYMLPHSKILCYVANKDGIYQVGDKINRIAGDYIYQLNDGDESKIKMLLLPKDQISIEDIKIIPTYSDAKGDWAQRTRYFSNDRYRIVSSLNSHTDGAIIYYDIITNPQKRTLGAWLRAQLNTKSANGTGIYYHFNSRPLDIFPAYDENTGLSTQTICMDLSQLPVIFETSYCPAYSRGRLITDGIPQWIYVYWYDALEYSPTFFEPTNWTPENEPF